MYLRILYVFQDEQRLLPYTVLTYWFYSRNRERLLCGTDWVFSFLKG